MEASGTANGISSVSSSSKDIRLEAELRVETGTGAGTGAATGAEGFATRRFIFPIFMRTPSSSTEGAEAATVTASAFTGTSSFSSTAPKAAKSSGLTSGSSGAGKNAGICVSGSMRSGSFPSKSALCCSSVNSATEYGRKCVTSLLVRTRIPIFKYVFIS